MKETAAHVVSAGYVDDGVALGPLAEAAALPAAERLHEAADAQDADAYGLALAGVAASCNTCHAATDHAFLHITPPTGAAELYPSQVFTPEAGR